MLLLILVTQLLGALSGASIIAWVILDQDKVVKQQR